VSQTINTDPEIRRLKRELGLTGFSMWLEVLSRTDQGNLWKGSEMDISGVLAGICESNTRGAAKALQWFTDIGWVGWVSDPLNNTTQTPSTIGNRGGLEGNTEGVYNTLQTLSQTPKQRGSTIPCRWGLFTTNHADFHKSREQKNTEQGNLIGSLPSEPSEPLKIKDPIDPPGRTVDKSEPDPEKKPEKGKEPWRPFADKIYQSDKQRFARIPAFINWTRKKGYSETVVTQGLARLFAALEKGLVVDEWWPYAKKLCEKAYTEEQQGQSSNYKKGGVESLGQVFDRIKEHRNG